MVNGKYTSIPESLKGTVATTKVRRVPARVAFYVQKYTEILAARERSKDPQWQYDHILSLFLKGDFSDGLSALAELCKRDFTPALNLAGFIYLHGLVGRKKNMLIAIKLLERSVEKGDITAIWALGLALYNQGRFEEARKYFEKTETYGMIEGGFMIGMIHESAGSNDSALYIYNQLSKIDGSNPRWKIAYTKLYSSIARRRFE